MWHYKSTYSRRDKGPSTMTRGLSETAGWTEPRINESLITEVPLHSIKSWLMYMYSIVILLDILSIFFKICIGHTLLIIINLPIKCFFVKF